MTKLLEEALSRARELPAEQQDALATLILEEIEDEARWDATFAQSLAVLERLAAEAERQV